MTWSEWINSYYNTDSFYDDGNMIYNANGLTLCNDAGSDYTSPLEIIVSYNTYTLVITQKPIDPPIIIE